MSALTGVGPSIASGSHVNSGNCALLPKAPSMRQKGISERSQPPTPRAASPKAWNSVLNSIDP